MENEVAAQRRSSVDAGNDTANIAHSKQTSASIGSDAASSRSKGKSPTFFESRGCEKEGKDEEEGIEGKVGGKPWPTSSARAAAGGGEVEELLIAASKGKEVMGWGIAWE